jgi:hypothetical protein
MCLPWGQDGLGEVRAKVVVESSAIIIGGYPETGSEEVDRISNEKSASVYRWREVAIAIAASA